ncbi:MAG: helix-turn-helix domain-containing protein [Clostridia bacterium]|nr:helix-turn-helix domain-containing protein [Clostridia bacterium]
MLKLYERIRTLRRKSGKTQEELADILGVSSQAVSRWESGGGYPDTETLPRLANCFGVSIDYLFGYEGDRERRVRELTDRVERMAWQNEYEDVNLDACIALLREGLAEYPGDERLRIALVDVLSRKGWMHHDFHVGEDYGEDGYIRYDVDRVETNSWWAEAKSLCEELSAHAESMEIRTKAARELIRIYRTNGECKKALALADTMPPLAFSREILRTEATFGAEQEGPLGEALLELAYEFAELLVYAVVNRKQHFETSWPVGKVKGAIAVFDLLADGGQIGIYHRERAYLNLYLSRLLWEYGQFDEAFAALNNAYKDARVYDAFTASGDYHYTAPLLRRAAVRKELFAESGSLTENLPESWPMWCNPDYENVKNEMQTDSRWEEWVKRCKSREGG